MHNGRLWRTSVAVTNYCGWLRELAFPLAHLEQPHRVIEASERYIGSV